MRITTGIMGTEVCLRMLMGQRPATPVILGPKTAATKMGAMMEVGIWEGMREGILGEIWEEMPGETRAETKYSRIVRGLFRRWWIARISMLQRSGRRLVRKLFV